MIEMVCCNKCGWVHMGVSRAYAEAEVKSFNDYFNALSIRHQAYYNGHLSCISNYETCDCCGNHWKDFRQAKDGDCPDGCTIGPIIHFSEGSYG